MEKLRVWGRKLRPKVLDEEAANQLPTRMIVWGTPVSSPSALWAYNEDAQSFSFNPQTVLPSYAFETVVHHSYNKR